MKSTLSLLVIFSIWTSLLAPFSSAQNSNLSDSETVEEKKGLQFRVCEGKADAPKVTPTPVSAKLNPTEAEAILKRLPEMPPETETANFKVRENSLPAPKTGIIIETKFPAEESQPPPKTTEPTVLRVLRFTPQGNLRVAPELTVNFSQPMIAVTSQEVASENVPVQLTPAVKGKWRWAGTQTLIFDPETRFPMATEFTAKVPAGTKSATGGVLPKDVVWKFSTPPPTIENFQPKGENVRPDTLIFAAFDQQINQSAVLAEILAFADGQRIPLRLATESEIAADENISNLIKQTPPNHWLVFRAVEPFPFDSPINVSFDIGTPSAEGNLTTKEPQNFSFKTFGALKLVKGTCGYGEINVTNCSPSSNPTFEFNNPLETINFDHSLVKIEPKVEAKISIYGDDLRIDGEFKPRTSYTITVSKNLKDVFGQTLGEVVSTKFTFGAKVPNLDSQYYNDFITLDPNAKPVFSVFSTNYDSLKVRIYAVKPKDFPAIQDWDNDSLRNPPFGKLVYNQTVKVKNVPDEPVETPINLAPALNKGVGQAILIVEPPEPKKDRELIVKWFQATQIGIDTFLDREQMAVYTSRLKDGKPLGNVQLTLSNGATGVSGADGMATLKFGSEKPKKEILFAQSGADTAILDIDDYYFRQDSEDSVNQDQLRWHVFDDRGIYRPNETVSIKGYLRKVTGGKFSDISELAEAASGVSYFLKDARGNEIAKGSAKLNAFGAFDFQINLPGNLNLGRQNLELQAVSTLKGNSTVHNFQVQEFRRPEFEVSASVESAAPFYLGDSATLLTEAKYYSGGGLANAETNWEISAEPTSYTPPNRDDFTFGKFTPWWGDYYESNYEFRTREEFKGKTDLEGKHRIALDFLKANPARPYSVEAEGSVQDVNRQAFTGKTTLLVHPSKLYVGLRSAKPFVQAGETFKIETIATDIDGKSVANAPVSVTAELKDWQQVKGEWEEVVIDTQKCEVKSASEVVSCDFTAKQGGTYTITARVLDEKERPNESELTVWVAGGNREKSRSVEGEEIELIPNQKEYAPGETAEILLNAPFYPAEGVLLLERNGIIKTERFTVEKSSTVLKIPIEEAYLPNVHIEVNLVGASELDLSEDGGGKNLLKVPAFATGELNLNISTASRKLTVVAEPLEKTVLPGGQTKVNIAVTDSYGKVAANTEIALVAVDESVLALTGYKIKNPLDIFYQELEAETNSSHSRENVMLSGVGYGSGSGRGTAAIADQYADVTDFSIGSPNAKTSATNLSSQISNSVIGLTTDRFGTAKISIVTRIDESPESEKSLPMMQLRRNFAALAIFAPSVKTDADGKATVELKLPDNLTRYRITAVAVTKSKQFGLGESNVTAKQSLQIRPSAPRFMNFGDKAELPVVVQNQTDAPMTVNVAIRSNNATLTDGNARRVMIPANERAEIRFPVKTEVAGIARFQIGAVSEKFADAAEIEFPVYTPATGEAFATYGTTEKDGAIIQKVSAPTDVFSEFGGLELTTSSTQLQELTDAFIYLQNYPFECSEQIASRMLSVAALRDVLTAFNAKDLPSKSQIEAKMKSDLERLQKLQHKDGGFSFWRNDDESFPFVSIHVIHALARAKSKGYDVPKEMMDKSLIYLSDIESKIPSWYSQESRWTLSAYSYFVRHLLNEKTAIPKARLLLQNATLEKLSIESIGWILSVLADDKNSAAEVESIKRHLLNRVTETADKAHFVTNYKDRNYALLSSERRADALILEALLKVGSGESGVGSEESLVPKLVRGLLANRTKGRWSSTQENAFVLLAMDEYFRKFEKATPNFVAKVWLGESFADEQKFAGRSTESRLVNVPMNYLQTSNTTQNLILDKQGDGRLYYRIGLKYAPKNLNLAAADYGFQITRQYEAVDNPNDVKQLADGSWTIRAGARVRVRVQMINQLNRYHVALVDNLPAGLEIINPELKVFSKFLDNSSTFRFADVWFDHQNLRDHRAEAFQDSLDSGVWNYSYIGRATTIGEFVVPPAKAEEMYSPETFGRSKTDLVKVE